MARGRVALSTALVALASVLGGCFGDVADDPVETPPPSPPTSTPPVDPSPDAGSPEPRALPPWWPVGSYWDVEIQRGAEAAQTYRLVNMWNDSESSHFWLGVAERGLAVEHALFDTNPFLGRMHHTLLAPHESGMHAVMYDFPVTDGKRWRGLLLGGDWEFEARADATRPGAFFVSGAGTDGSTIAYDYDPATGWFRNIIVRDGSGATTLTATVTASGSGESGTFYFERGRDYYVGPEGSEGPLLETLTVEDEGLDFLAVHLSLIASAPLELQLVDPSGAVAHRELAPTGALATLVEIPAPSAGEWTLRYVTPGTIEGEARVVGMFETKKEI